jgi:hypothetical protein
MGVLTLVPTRAAPTRFEEYLFIDRHRIESYFDLISDEQRKDDVPTWEIALGLTTTATSQSDLDRMHLESISPYSLDEKAQIVHDHIEAQSIINQGAAGNGVLTEAVGSSYAKTPFIEEVLEARKATLKTTEGELDIWVSIFTKDTGRLALYLIENYRHDDFSQRRSTGHRSLKLLANELVLHSPAGNPLEAVERQDDMRWGFGRDPVMTLLHIGATFGPLKKIKVLYRFRISCVEIANGEVVIGYPLIIQEIGKE